MSKLVRAIYGPTTGLVTLEDAEAEAAIKDGWAVDPYTAYEFPAGFDVEKATKAAVKAHEKRNKPAAPAAEEKPAPKKAEEKVESTKADEPMKTTDDASYKTRVSKPKE